MRISCIAGEGKYGLLVFWHLKQALEANEVIIDINHSCCLKILSEHSGAIGEWEALKIDHIKILAVSQVL